MKKTMLAIAAVSALMISGSVYAAVPALSATSSEHTVNFTNRYSDSNGHGKNLRVFVATKNAAMPKYVGKNIHKFSGSNFSFSVSASKNNRVFVYNAAASNSAAFSSEKAKYCYCEFPAFTHMMVIVENNTCYVRHNDGTPNEYKFGNCS